MNKKGFTLIELLAVIVILAIIALITTPIVLNLINQSKEASNKRSVEAYAKAVEYAVAQYEYNHNGELPADFDVIKNDVEYSNSDVKCNVAINCDNKGSVELTGCQVGSYTNNYYKYSSTKGNKGATVDDTNDAPGGNTSVKATCSGSSSESSQSTESFVYQKDGSSWGATLNNNWEYYLRKNTDTDLYEVCGVFSGQTVCIESNKWDCDEQSNGQCVNSTGYIASKINEFSTKGVTCQLESYFVECSSGELSCNFDSSGVVTCGVSGNHCTMYPGDDPWCD